MQYIFEQMEASAMTMKSKAFIPGKYIIYLDQFAVSGMTDKTGSWAEAYNILAEAVTKGLVICPLSAEHLLETSAKTDDGAISQHDLLSSLSGGFILKPEPFISAQLLISTLRKNNITAYTFFERKINPGFTYSNSLERLRERKAGFGTMIDEATGFANSLNEIQRGMKVKTEVKNDLFEASKIIAVREFLSRLRELIVLGGIRIRGVSFSVAEVPHWIDYILDILMKKHKMVTSEAVSMFSLISKHGFSNVSSLDVRITLLAYANVNFKKQTANDQVDIMRVATALQVSDIMVVDKSRKFELNETGLTKKYNTVVYSGSPSDTNLFVETLKKILSGKT